MRLKDHYTTLGVAPSAEGAEIKKAYRALAFKYHPDKNPDNAFAEAHFKELQEAYSILSNTARRQRYDEERWLAGMGNRMRDKQAITPQWILDECRKLSAHIAIIDTHRMSHSSLRDYILLILSDSHIGVLQQYNDDQVNHSIIDEILKATKYLQARYIDAIAARLALLAGADSEALLSIHAHATLLKKRERQDSYLPLWIIVIVVMLCVLMYLYGK